MKLIGFDASEGHRTYGDRNDDPKYDIQYPLREWGWDRDKCKQVIADASLPVPVKSACFMCPASKKPEIVALAEAEPELFEISVEMERNYREGKHYRGPESTCQGLGGRFAWESLLATQTA